MNKNEGLKNKIVRISKMDNKSIEILEVSEISTPANDSSVRAYKCPRCDRLFSSSSLAEDCLKAHVMTITED